MITLSIDDHVYYINIIIIIYDDKIIIIAKLLIYIYTLKYNYLLVIIK